MSLQYYRWFPGDYIRDTRRLTMLQHGAYRLLLDEYMVTGRPLPNDLPALYRVCGAMSGEEHTSVQYVLTEFFQLDGPVWRHKRCDEELAHQDDRSKKAKVSATARWGSERNANAMRTHNERSSERNAIQNQITTTTNVVVGAAVADAADSAKAVFDAGVALLAKTEGEKNARSLIGKMRKHLTDETLLPLIEQARAASNPSEYLIVAARKTAVMQRIASENGGARVTQLSDGGFKCDVHFYNSAGKRVVQI